MTSERLHLLASDGFEGVRPTEFADLAAWCRDWCVATGDARFCLLSETLQLIFDAFGEQGLPAAISDAIDEALRRALPHILLATDLSSGSQQANYLLNEIGNLPLWPEQWLRIGLVRRADDVSADGGILHPDD